MHTLYPNVQEDMQFPKLIIVKPDSAKCVLKLIYEALFGHLKQLFPELQNF
jgi:hypothetical protein